MYFWKYSSICFLWEEKIPGVHGLSLIHIFCGKIFPDLPVFHVLKLYAADCIEPVYGDWKTEKGYFPVPDAPDSLFAAADCDSAAVYRH